MKPKTVYVITKHIYNYVVFDLGLECTDDKFRDSALGMFSFNRTLFGNLPIIKRFLAHNPHAK